MRETEEERQAALIASSVLDEALGDIRLQYEVHAEDLTKRVKDARGVLDAAAAQEQRESTLAAHERMAAEAEPSLRLREEAAAKRDRTTLTAKASVARHAEELRLREEACRERDAALAEREAEVNRREVASCRLGEQLAKREEAVAGREAQHLESARAVHAAMAARASELEAREKDLAAGGQPGGAELVSQLTAAHSTLADLERLVQDQAREIAALRLTNEIGPGQLSNAVDRLERAGRRVSISVRRDSKLPPTQPALVLRLDGLVADLERLEEEVGETMKSSSASLARAAVELVLASHQARNPDFVPWPGLEDFPPGT
ncbi:uncharacterized protein [Oryza sativa Japonica Group]|uniref:uncharacterized protein n=1 Tax=Oryza sativa subsp. japonica TaxID=39947 RepID=UPI0007754B50|nr:uncharacterized protein LOC107280591 [Oryza sativa Japonica Group]